MDFGANKTPVEVIKEDTFGRTYFRDIYSGVTGKWYKKSWKELVRRLEDDKRQINRWKKIVSRFRSKLVKMIKDASSKYDDYSFSPKIKQILLHWVMN